ncbi:ribonuclease D [Haloferula helveola]|uniref:Ribonuclease D n=1 Tax=Haloferula helveola TaxID=490095 RepID=A0ABN6GZ09_9BACT|nr:ribonuclease D [Haloferula helveola]
MESVSSEFIDTPAALGALLAEVGDEPVCAVDTEADSLHRYRESLCLIQFAWGSRCVLVDPLAIEDLGTFYDYLTGSTVWMHGADYDMTMIRRECDQLPVKVYDTQIGARLLGVRKFGLANLVEHYFDVSLSKSSQKADWGKRPLSPKMVDYALNDVRYLLPMGEMIVKALKESGRFGWFVESCEWAKAKVLERDELKDEPWRIQGAGRLDRKGLNYLRCLWNWRDSEAEQWDRPSFMVVTNKQLVEWSQILTAGGRLDLPHHYRPDRKRRLSAALKEAEAADPSSYPKKMKGLRRRRDRDFDQRVNDLIGRRNKIAKELDIDSSLLGSRAMIEALAAEDEGYESQWMDWQKECLGLA